MKDVASAIGSEVFQPFVSLLLPGSIASAPFLITLVQRHPNVEVWVHANEWLAVFASIGIGIFAGLILENLGSQLEYHLFDRLRDRATSNRHTEFWHRYLRIAFHETPVGHRHLRRIVLRLQFELASGVALLIAGLGTQFVAGHACPWWVLPGLGVLLLISSWQSHGVLSRWRERFCQEGLFFPPGMEREGSRSASDS